MKLNGQLIVFGSPDMPQYCITDSFQRDKLARDRASELAHTFYKVAITGTPDEPIYT